MTIFLLALRQSSCSNLYVSLRFSCWSNVRQASPSYILSWYIAKLTPILIHYRTISYHDTLPNYPYLLTLPNHNQPQYINEVYPILKHYRTISNPNTLPNYTLSYYFTNLYPILIPFAAISNLNTLPIYTIFYYITELNHIFIHYRTIPYLNTLTQSIPYLNTLSRTIPYLNTLPNYTLSYNIAELYPILIHWAELYPILIHWSEPYLNTSQSAANQIRARKNHSTSSANQKRVLRHPRALCSGGGPFSAVGSSRLAIAYLNTWGSPPPSPHLVCSLLYFYQHFLRLRQYSFFFRVVFHQFPDLTFAN